MFFQAGREVREGPSEEATFEEGGRESCKTLPGRGDGECKGPEAGASAVGDGDRDERGGGATGVE